VLVDRADLAAPGAVAGASAGAGAGYSKTGREGVMSTPENDALRLQMEYVARQLAARIDEGLPKGIGYTLLLYEFGEGGWLSYICNGKREDMIKAMKEFIEKNEEGQEEILGPSH
jgi:hypothetical protein